MGMESFYIDLTVKSRKKEIGLPVISEERQEDLWRICVSYSYFSFFEGIYEIFDFIQSNKEIVVLCKANNEEIKTDSDFLSFFGQLYRIHESKLDYFFKHTGKLIVKSGAETYRFGRKNRKYIKLFQENEGTYVDRTAR